MTEAKGMQIFKIFTFLCMIAIVAALGVDYSIDTTFLFVTVRVWRCIQYVAWRSRSDFFKRYNLLKNAMWQLIIVTVGCIIWDWLTGWHGWSIDFVLPGVSGLIMISMLIISRVYYRQAKDYLVYFVMAALYGMILPFFFLVTGKVQDCISVCDFDWDGSADADRTGAFQGKRNASGDGEESTCIKENDSVR